MRKFGRFMFSFVPMAYAELTQSLGSCFLLAMAGIAAYFSQKEFVFSGMFDWLSHTEFQAAIMLLYCLLTAPVLFYFYKKQYQGALARDAAELFHPLKLAGAILIVPGSQMLASFITVLVSMLLPHALDNYTQLMENAGIESQTGPLMMAYAVIVGPICEEIIFRGCTMRNLRKVCPFWVANLIQALLFGIYHMNIIQGAYAFAFGIFLGCICEWGGTIYYSITTHILFNFWGMVLADYIEGPIAQLSDAMQYVVSACIMVVSFAIAIPLFLIGKKLGKPVPEYKRMVVPKRPAVRPQPVYYRQPQPVGYPGQAYYPQPAYYQQQMSYQTQAYYPQPAYYPQMMTQQMPYPQQAAYPQMAMQQMPYQQQAAYPQQAYYPQMAAQQMPYFQQAYHPQMTAQQMPYSQQAAYPQMTPNQQTPPDCTPGLQ